jgi:hypothetical protein
METTTSSNQNENFAKMTVEEFLKEQFNLKIAEFKCHAQQKIDKFREEAKRVRAILESLERDSEPTQ